MIDIEPRSCTVMIIVKLDLMESRYTFQRLFFQPLSAGYW